MLRTVTLALLALLLVAPAASAQQPTPLPAPPGGEGEPNQTPETATPIAAGERIRARLAPGDTDLYRFSATAGDLVFAATMTAGSASGDADSRLALLAPDGETIESDNDNGHLWVDSSSIAGAAIPATGTYYLRVDSPQSSVDLRPYDLVLDVRSDGGLVAGTMEAGDEDTYPLELGAGDTVFASLDLDPERDGTSFNGRLGFGGLVADDAGLGDQIPSEAIFGTANSAGRYFLSVDAPPAQTGAYRLSITVIPAVERGCRTYTVEPADGAIPDRGTATFPIDVPDAATIDHVAVRLDVTHDYLRDLDATLEAPAGSRSALFNDLGPRNRGQNTRMRITLDENAASPSFWDSLDDYGFQPEFNARLSWFDGQRAAGTWTLTLRDDAADDTGTLARFDLIVCARPEEGPADTVFSAGFEDGDDGFTHSGTADEWERGTPATPETGPAAGLTSCAAGAGCFKTDLDGTYEANSSQDLVSPPISLAGRSGPIYVSWQMWHQLENANYDRLEVRVEEDGGADARPLYTWAGDDMIATHGVGPAPAIPLSAGWARHRADVSGYAGRTIRLRFHVDSDDTVQRRGVAIDDVRVYQPLAVAAAEDAPSPASSPAGVAPASAAAEPAIADLRLDSRCVRATAGRVRVGMTMRLAQPGAVRVRVDRAVGSRGRSTCPRANPERNQRFRRVATFRRVARMRAQAAAVTRRVTLDLRLRPGLYRLTVRVGDSPPVRRFMRVVG